MMSASMHIDSRDNLRVNVQDYRPLYTHSGVYVNIDGDRASMTIHVPDVATMILLGETIARLAAELDSKQKAEARNGAPECSEAMTQ